MPEGVVATFVHSLIVDNYLEPENYRHPLTDAVVLKEIGLDSLDTVQLAMDLEDKFDIPAVSDVDVSKWVTVGDVVAYVEQHLPKSS